MPGPGQPQTEPRRALESMSESIAFSERGVADSSRFWSRTGLLINTFTDSAFGLSTRMFSRPSLDSV